MEQRLMKTCDHCKARKVRCIGADVPGAAGCTNCARRNVQCRFSLLQKPRRRGRNNEVPTPTASSPPRSDDTPRREETNHAAHDMTQYDGLQQLYIDRLLANSRPASSLNAQSVSLQGLGIFGNEYSLTFFTEARLTSLALKLGHNRVSRIRAQVASVIQERMKAVERVPLPATDMDRNQVFGADKALIVTYVQSYFDHVHPTFPFLDRRQVEAVAYGEELWRRLASDRAWSALFYTILALGSQYHDGGSFQPGNSIAWKFFSTALAIFPDLLILKATLETVQAITAMAIYSSTVSQMQFSHVMISEGAKKAQALGYSRCTSPGNDAHNRAFWVLYCLEKTLTFTIMKSSVIMDSDISSPVPSLIDSQSELGDGFDWFLSWVKLSRLLSRIYASLHSVSVTGRPASYYRATITRLKAELEAWRATIPAHIRPGRPIRPHAVKTSRIMAMCVKLQYNYDSTMLHLDRARLQLEDEDMAVSDAITDIMRTARSILGITKYIHVQPYTPLWELAGVPLAALLVLFDLVIDHPTHPDTAANLALIDVGCGYFSHIEYASEGALPGSIASEFAHIARSYVREKSSTSQLSSPPVVPIIVTSNGNMSVSELPTSEHTSGYTSGADWNFQGLGAPSISFPGTDILDLFGSSIPGWDTDWILSAHGDI